MHDAILIGVGTLLADDPLLTARLVQGPSPLPVVLDSQLRSPSTSRLVSRAAERGSEGTGLVVVTTEGRCEEKDRRAQVLKAIPGVHILAVPEIEGRPSLHHALSGLKARFGCGSLMVEGGRSVIASFLADPGLVTSFVATISPKFIGGLGPAAELAKSQKGQAPTATALMRLRNMSSCRVGDDIVVYGAPAGARNGRNGKKPQSPSPQPDSQIMPLPGDPT